MAPPRYDSADWWTSQIKQGLDFRKKQGREDRWNHIKRYYEHRLKNPLNPNFNLIYMLGSSLLPALMFQRPSIVNTARRPEFIPWAGFFDSIDNWLFDEMEVEDVGESAVLNAYLFNTAAIKFGYDFPENALALEMLEEPAVIPELQRVAAGDPSQEVREMATEALESLMNP